MSENDTRTPPQIVAAADSPESALMAFIAQELEAWGFSITEGDGSTQVVVGADSLGPTFEVEVWSCR
jgi:hypothetical protein